ncbi:hypothetical protein ACFX2I_040278 [Malus domestica]
MPMKAGWVSPNHFHRGLTAEAAEEELMCSRPFRATTKVSPLLLSGWGFFAGNPTCEARGEERKIGLVGK